MEEQMVSVKINIRLKKTSAVAVDEAVALLNKAADPGQPAWTRSSYVAAAVLEKLEADA